MPTLGKVGDFLSQDVSDPFSAKLPQKRCKNVCQGCMQPYIAASNSFSILGTLLLDSRVLRDQQLNERRKQRFASLADVVHELEEPQVDREFLLGNASMRTQPTA